MKSLLFLVTVTVAFGQTGSLKTNVSMDDHSASTATKPMATGTLAARPATCSVGSEYFATDATAGQNIYLCTSTNTWTQVVGSGGSITTVTGTTGISVVNPTGPTVQVAIDTATDPLRGDLQSGSSPLLLVSSDGGTAYTACNLSSVLAAYSTGQAFLWTAGLVSSSTTPTLDICTKGVKTLTDKNGAALASTTAITAGSTHWIVNDGTGFRILDLPASGSSAPFQYFGGVTSLTLNGSNQVLWSTTVPALAANSCYEFWLDVGDSTTDDNVNVYYWVDGSQAGGVQTGGTQIYHPLVNAVHGYFYRDHALYCNVTAQSAQVIQDIQGDYNTIGSHGAGGNIANPSFLAPPNATPTAVDWSTSHTVTVTVSAASGAFNATRFWIK